MVEKAIIENKYSNIVIDDLRYPNELEMLRKYNFTIIKLCISRSLQTERLKITYPKTYKEHLERLDHKPESYYNIMAFDKEINIVKNENIKEVQVILGTVMGLSNSSAMDLRYFRYSMS